MRFSQNLITVLLSIILTMSMLSLQFKPSDGVTELARQTKENMNCVALKCKRLTHARRELCVITEKGKWMTRRCGLFSQVSFHKKSWKFRNFTTFVRMFLRTFLQAAWLLLTMHNKTGTFIRQPTPTHNKNRDPYRCMLEWDTETTLLFKNKKSMKKDYLVNSWYTAIFNMRQIIWIILKR